MNVLPGLLLQPTGASSSSKSAKILGRLPADAGEDEERSGSG